MRPEILFPIFKPLTTLTGVGPSIAKKLEAVAGPHLVDLCWLLPFGLVDRNFSPKVADAPAGSIVTLVVKVDAHQPPPKKRLPYKIIVSDETGHLTLTFFHGRPDYLNKTLPIGETRVISGRIEDYEGTPQMSHPDRIGTLAEIDEIRSVEPVYPLTAGLGPRPMAKAVRAALATMPELSEWLDPAYLKQNEWPGFHAALMEAHRPQSDQDLAPSLPARRRLAYDELLANQLAISLVRMHTGRRAGYAFEAKDRIGQKIISALPYSLTESQKTVLQEIKSDMQKVSAMTRLLQGDVGSGKTIVALLAMADAVECGKQAAFLAPTDVLARQHADALAPLAKASGIRLALLTGRDKGKAREALLNALKEGEIDILVGTHAIFQKGVDFRELGFAVIDEQHRFGVHQRIELTEKASGPDRRAADVLLMTATPIPRTLALTAYGDMDVSRLLEKPPGRRPIATRAMPLQRLEEVIAGVSRAIQSGNRIYWVCPLVAESETLDVAAAEDRFDYLNNKLPGQVALMHGQMKNPEKDAAFAAFSSGQVKILVATTVIEVGVDVPEATVIVIEHAERFGLAQLHQLRGRVGRSDAESSCILLYANPLGETAAARIKILRETEDGFRIAEEDLKLRGAGELLGTRQSGLPDFRLANLAAHADLLQAAHDDARLILNRDPDLASDRGEALRTLLYLFERDHAVRYLRSG